MVDFKVGDHVTIHQMTSGLSGNLIGKEAVVTSIYGIKNIQPFIEIQVGGSKILLYCKDVRHTKPPKDLRSFKQYLKTSMAANVAAV